MLIYQRVPLVPFQVLGGSDTVHGWTKKVLGPPGISDADGSAESPGHLLPGVRGPDSRSPYWEGF